MYRSTLLGMAALAGSVAAFAQQGSTPGDVFAHNTPGYQVYNDQFSTNCSRGNTSPYKGMNPLVCHGVMAPADSRGQCSLRGMRVLRQVGNTCYYCQPINPPINGVVIPIDQLQNARVQGFTCGVDQANPNCMAVCYRDSGGGPAYVPAGRARGPRVSGSGGRYYGWPGPAIIPGDPCHAPGGYDYCQIPPALSREDATAAKSGGMRGMKSPVTAARRTMLRPGSSP